MRQIEIIARGSAGAGKSTVLNIIAEALESKGMQVTFSPGIPRSTELITNEVAEVLLVEEDSNGIPGHQVGSIGGLDTP